MTMAEALSSVDSELAARQTDSRHFEKLQINLIRAGSSCAWGDVLHGRPCFEFYALFGASGFQDHAMKIGFDQFFDDPIPLKTFKQVVEAAYGKPRMFVAPDPAYSTGPKEGILSGYEYPEPAWAWGGGTINEEALRSRLMSPFKELDLAEASEPVLTINTRMRDGLVYGIRVHAWDPKVLKKHQDVLKRAMEEFEEKKAREAASKIKLK
jgi:hypothetical protein